MVRGSREMRLRDGEPVLDRSQEAGASPAPALSSHGLAAMAHGEPGRGILPDGTAHPAVSALIAARRGSGYQLPAAIVDDLSPAIGDRLGDVRVHADDTADALAHGVAARAFTTGTDVYFAAGEYRPGTREGDRLLAHELTHVAQQRGAPNGGPVRVSQPGDAMENEADAVADELAG